MALGRGNRLSDAIVFSVQTPENPPTGARYYWRARVYDVYENGQWKSSLDATRTEDPDTYDLKYPVEPNRGPQLFSFTFTTNSPVATLFTAPQPVWVSRPAKVELATNPDGTVDLGAFRASPTLRAGETYTARSSLSDVSIAQMREAGTNYPDWVKQRYLELPPEITPRTLQLAQEIAGKQITAFDKANAITEYLRSNIQYSAVVPQLPQNQELVDWFLFDLKKGFCNYYATAEIVLLRSLGIPARLGVGYAQGERLANAAEYVIRQRDAHAWPEVYFPGVGWVEFEPTAGQPDLARPIGVSTINPSILEQLNQLNDIKSNTDPGQLSNSPLPGLVPGLEALAKSPKFQQTFLVSLLSLSLLAALAGFAWKRGLYQRITPVPILLDRGFRRIGIRPPSFLHLWALYYSLSPLARAYHEINRALARLGTPPRPTETPSERATLLVSELPAAATPAQRLLAEYETATYGKRAADIQAAKQAGAEIRSLSLKAFFQRLFRRRKDLEKENSW
jgi:transglutaminase-like putative cysteine protease